MANYIPRGWRCSPTGAALFVRERELILSIIGSRLRKYGKGLPGHSPEDLRQEGELAACYAVDTYSKDKGNFKGYVGTVVANALAMVASEVLAQCRQPHTHVQNQDGTWSKVPVSVAELMDVHEDDTANAEQALLARERRVTADRRNAASTTIIKTLGMSEDAQLVLRLKQHPPPELWVKARNLNGGQYRINSALMADHLGWPLARFNRAVTDMNAKLRQFDVEVAA